MIGKPASGLGRNKSGLPRRAPIPSFRTPSSFPKTPNTLLRAASANNLDDSVDEDDIDEYADGKMQL